MKINDQTGPCLVMAGAGMCNAGRILHHLKQNLWKPDTHVLIVGYQGPARLAAGWWRARRLSASTARRSP